MMIMTAKEIANKTWELWNDYYKDGDLSSDEILTIIEADIISLKQGQTLPLDVVTPSLNCDIRPHAEKHLEGYYGKGDSRAYEDKHITHFTRGWIECEKSLMKKFNKG
jgi:hypothetical protein